jgi:hypothetical protein
LAAVVIVPVENIAIPKSATKTPNKYAVFIKVPLI